MSIFVLVHGAFQGDWVWKDVATHLRNLGHEVHAPTLSGCGYLADGLREGIDLHTYVQDACNYLHYQDLRDVILVSHSFADMICPAVAVRLPLLVRRLLFVDAVIPQTGHSFADIAGGAFRALLETHRIRGWRVTPCPPPVFNVPKSKETWFRTRLREFPEAAFTTKFQDRFEAASANAAFITCTATPNSFIASMAGKAQSFGWPVFRLESGHSPMIACPERLAALLPEAA